MPGCLLRRSPLSRNCRRASDPREPRLDRRGDLLPTTADETRVDLAKRTRLSPRGATLLHEGTTDFADV